MPSFVGPLAFTGSRLLSSSRGSERAFFRWAGPAPVSQTVLKEGGSWVTVQNPLQSRLDAATHVFLGGHVYEVSDDLATELTAAGYGDCLS